jgi:HK97 family phage portal protein
MPTLQRPAKETGGRALESAPATLEVLGTLGRLAKNDERFDEVYDRAAKLIEEGPVELKASPLAWPDYRLGKPVWNIIDYQSYVNDGFNVNSLIYSAIMFKARQAGGAPLVAYEGDPNNPEPLPPDDELAQLIARPNPHQSWIEFQALREVYFNISGNCYTLIDRDRKGSVPRALWTLRPDRVMIVPKKRGKTYSVDYAYFPKGRGVGDGEPVLQEYMEHVKLPNPLDPFEGMGYGLAPISAAAFSGDTDNSVTRFLKMFFDRGGVPPYFVSFEEKLDKNVRARIRQELNDQWGGYENWMRPGILEAGGKIEKSGLTFKEMGFETLDSRNESRILGPFGVPGILIGSRLGLERAINANAKELHRMFWEDTMVPEIRLFEVEDQYFLNGDGKFVRYDFSRVPAFQEDKNKIHERSLEAFSAGAITREQFKIETGRTPDEGDDVYLIPFNIQPVPAGEAVPESGAEGATVEDDERHDDGKAKKATARP